MTNKKLLENLVFACLIAVSLSSCKKNDDKNDPTNNTLLIPASTGWTKVGTVPYSNTIAGLPGGNAMTPYDLAVVDNQLALLYSEDYKLPGVQGHKTFKVKFAPGSSIPASTPLQRGGWSFCYSSRFIPETFTPVYSKLDYINSSTYNVLIYRDEDGPIAGNGFGIVSPALSPINWYSDGGLTMSLRSENIADAVSYTFPNTGNFNIVSNEWNQDSTRWNSSDALRLSGGETNQFIISQKDSKVYFSLIKNTGTGNYPKANFAMLARQEITELNGAAFGGNSIIASNVVNDKYTVLVGEVSGTAITKVHCYQWQKGSSQFTKLYGNITVPEAVGKQLMSRGTTGVRPIEGANAVVKFTPDGTAYMIYHTYQNNSTEPAKYTALATMNAEGLKILGKYTATDNTYYEQLGLDVCQYYNGAYYAVIFQRREDLYSISDPKFRMEIVKLTP
jgi:hypothetical protein